MTTYKDLPKRRRCPYCKRRTRAWLSHIAFFHLTANEAQ